jgi:hypothetical protein
MSSRQTPSFRVEALEQRILLSAVPLDGALTDYQDDDFSAATTFLEEYNGQDSVADGQTNGADSLDLDAEESLFAGAIPLGNSLSGEVLEADHAESATSNHAQNEDGIQDSGSSTALASSDTSTPDDKSSVDIDGTSGVVTAAQSAPDFEEISSESNSSDLQIEPTSVASEVNAMLDQQKATLNLGQGPPSVGDLTDNGQNALDNSDLEQNTLSPATETNQLPVSLLAHIYPDFASLKPNNHPTLALSPSDLGATIGIGDGAAGDYVLTDADIDFLSAFEHVIIGGENAHHTFNIGNSDSSENGVSEITFNFSLSLIAPKDGAEIFQHANIVVGEGHSLEIVGSRNSTHLSGTTTVAGNLTYNDAVILDGGVVLNIGGDFSLTSTGSIRGNGDGVADSLRISAGGIITIGGDIGGADFHDLTLNTIDSIIVESGVTISTRSLAIGDDAITGISIADSGDITLSANSVEVKSGARLLSHIEDGSTFDDGDITIEAKLSILSALVRFTGGGSLATILLDGVTVRAGDVKISAVADDRIWWMVSARLSKTWWLIG